ncbi:MAG: NAD-dependent epimerase/dehydratase family protein [Chloroflexi bacterium]|jgi:nucleoside-diphosphate-sugar epimerase|nr:NAD-dependent epimerase/dehydratase family protein [Chloroflexota bacterium]
MLNLVTGATGMIGSHLVEALLARGETVRALVRPTSQAARLRELGVELRIGSLTDNATLMAAADGVERVYHCAALVQDYGPPQAFEQANVIGVRNILAAATRARVSRFVFVSTTDIYGFPGRPVSESERPSPRGIAYTDSKIEGERLVWNHHRSVKLPVSIIRPATVFGPGSRLLVAGLIELLRRRQLPHIDEGQHIAGLTYVGNLVDLMLLAADNEQAVGQAYNASDASDITWAHYIEQLAGLAELPPPRKSYPYRRAFTLASLWEGWYNLRGRTDRPPLTRLMVELMGTDQLYPITKAQQQLGYAPRMTFDQGMRAVHDYMKRNGLTLG